MAATKRAAPVIRRKAPASKKEPFPWVIFLLLIGSIYAFWIAPIQLGTPHPSITFSKDGPAVPDPR